MIINNNMNAMGAHRNMSFNTAQTGKAMEKLSSGLRINRAGDDAAGLAISEKMRGQIRGLDQATRNAQDGISLIQTAEGALNETHSILQRMRELAVQSSNDTVTQDDRGNLQDEMDQLASEITRIADTTEFNKKTLMGSGDQFQGKFLIGANGGQTLDVSIARMDSVQLGVGVAGAGAAAAVDEVATVTGDGDEFVAGGVDLSGYTQSGNLDIKIEVINAGNGSGTSATANVTINNVTKTITADSDVAATPTFTLGSADFSSVLGSGQEIKITGAATPAGGDEVNIKVSGASTSVTGITIEQQGDAESSIATIDNAIKTVSEERSKLGAAQNRLEHTINNLGTSAENLQAAESRIRDVDMAKEMMNFTKNNILNQAAQAMMAQSKSQPEAVLQLLR
ncbi:MULTISPECIES: flagellin [unclassified Exiguobacterium]|uniref:flagellin N-terminal helical domain-containing protein n=1 Tax=unclassified Exiguobacterium TaxID=2644629 RepID=UPI001BEB5AE5|nr:MULTISPECIES: flagellin [unclassified Exiguobacterium]